MAKYTTRSTMKMEVISKQTIKPSSPTPPNHQTYKLCLLDQAQVLHHAPVLFFYPATATATAIHDTDNTQKLQILKTSLSNTLTRYYPFAGRLKDHQSIDCNDKGAEFIVTRVNCSLSDVLQKPDILQLGKLFPDGFQSTIELSDSLLIVQANLFQCGGIALGICLAHNIADAVSYFTFVKSWALIARDAPQKNLVIPNLTIASDIFPPLDSDLPRFDFPKEKWVARRFVFSSSSVSALKEIAASKIVQNPTRTEAVVALLWKCLMKTTPSRSSNYLCGRAVNLRRRMNPELSPYAVGNLLASLVTLVKKPEKEKEEIELKSIVAELRKDIKQFRFEKGENVFGKTNAGMMDLVKNGDASFFYVTMSCGMDAYDVDFGWGKPVWFLIFNWLMSNLAILNDTREGDGSIEAILYLTEQDATIFENNRDLLAYATLNPPILSSSAESSRPSSRI